MSEDAGIWWRGAGLPDLEALLGPEGVSAVGGVADEALKLFVTLRERAGAASAHPGAGEGDLGVVLSQLAGVAVRTVSEFAEAARSAPAGTDAPAPEGSSDLVQPGEAAACSYCPICQAVSLFRAVPMSTWQRLAGSIIDVAEAAPESSGPPAAPPIVVVPEHADDAADPVAGFLAGLHMAGEQESEH